MPHTPPELLPRKCQKCAKTTRPIIHAKCSLCQELGFEEEILCHLNRSIQNRTTFQCHAFQPILKLLGRPDQKPFNPNEDANTVRLEDRFAWKEQAPHPVFSESPSTFPSAQSLQCTRRCRVFTFYCCANSAP